MGLYRVVTFRQTADDLIKAAKRELKINIRHFKFEPEAHLKKEQRHNFLKSEYDKKKINLLETCRKGFAEVYIIYSHLKVILINWL